MYIGRDNPLENDRTPIRRKLARRLPDGRRYEVFLDSQVLPFFKLRNSDLLDTADLCRLFGVSMRTVYRWMAERDLRWAMRQGRNYLFTKGEILDWYEECLPILGRPPERGRSR